MSGNSNIDMAKELEISSKNLGMNQREFIARGNPNTRGCATTQRKTKTSATYQDGASISI
jgi:hypothetical protein